MGGVIVLAVLVILAVAVVAVLLARRRRPARLRERPGPELLEVGAAASRPRGGGERVDHSIEEAR